MSIPDFSSLMLPLLESLKDSKAHNTESIRKALACHFECAENELSQVEERMLVAKDHLKKVGLMEETKEGFRITSLGKLVLNRRLNSIDVEYLRRFPKVRE